MSLRVVIAEDNPLLRDGIAMILADHDIDVVAAVSNAEDLLFATEQHRPDVAVVDVRMPPTHTDEGIRAALTIRSVFPDVSVLVFSQWIELTYARQLLIAPANVGYLLKDRVISTTEFIDALRRVANGGTALDPEVVRQLLTRPNADPGLRRLTDRESGVLALLAEGLANQAIADRENLAIRSVEKVIASIFDKLDLPAGISAHRRVLAVLRYLNATT
jgi:DNA-binding NarL/FixJ family response regulator